MFNLFSLVVREVFSFSTMYLYFQVPLVPLLVHRHPPSLLSPANSLILASGLTSRWLRVNYNDGDEVDPSSRIPSTPPHSAWHRLHPPSHSSQISNNILFFWPTIIHTQCLHFQGADGAKRFSINNNRFIKINDAILYIIGRFHSRSQESSRFDNCSPQGKKDREGMKAEEKKRREQNREGETSNFVPGVVKWKYSFTSPLSPYYYLNSSLSIRSPKWKEKKKHSFPDTGLTRHLSMISF